MLETFEVICKFCFFIYILSRIFDIQLKEPGHNSKMEKAFEIVFVIMVIIGMIFFFQDL